jgi:hypothetical protein
MRSHLLEAVWERTEAVPLDPIPVMLEKWPEVSVSKVRVFRVHAAPWVPRRSSAISSTRFGGGLGGGKRGDINAPGASGSPEKAQQTRH